MDNKNVFVAIALSMSVLLFWGAFFETPKKPIDPKNNQKVEQKSESGSIAPTINQPTIVKNIFKFLLIIYLYNRQQFKYIP